MQNKETQEFNGIIYTRYPHSKCPTSRTYFRAMKYFSGKYKRLILHREVWKFYKGEIPKKYHIHHIDGDTANNDISNLECLSPSEHSIYHNANMSEETKEINRRNLDKIRPKAIAWGKTEEGKKFRQGFRDRVKNKQKKLNLVCKKCNEIFTCTNTGTNKYCSKKCREDFFRYCSSDCEERNCLNCNKKFIIHKNETKKYCDHNCYINYRFNKNKIKNIK